MFEDSEPLYERLLMTIHFINKYSDCFNDPIIHKIITKSHFVHLVENPKFIEKKDVTEKNFLIRSHIHKKQKLISKDYPFLYTYLFFPFPSIDALRQCIYKFVKDYKNKKYFVNHKRVSNLKKKLIMFQSYFDVYKTIMLKKTLNEKIIECI